MNYYESSYWDNHSAVLSKTKQYMLEDLIKFGTTQEKIELAIVSGDAPYHYSFEIDFDKLTEDEKLFFKNRDSTVDIDCYRIGAEGRHRFSFPNKKH